MIRFSLNDQQVEYDGDPSQPLLWYLRDEKSLMGTKFGCGVSLCGACTVHMNGTAVRSCSLPMASVAGAKIRTIEGLASAAANAVQTAWQNLDVVQCGYCQSGQIMSAVALLESRPNPTDADIDFAMEGNLCRCATYHRIRAAIRAAAEMVQEQSR